MAGRPTKLTPEVRRKLEEAAALDCTIEEMCFYADIHKDTYYSWIKADKELSDRLEELRNEPVLAARQTIIRALKTNPQQANWYLERKRKKEFAERKELTGQDGQPLFDEEAKAKGKAAIAGYLGNTGNGK